MLTSKLILRTNFFICTNFLDKKLLLLETLFRQKTVGIVAQGCSDFSLFIPVKGRPPEFRGKYDMIFAVPRCMSQRVIISIIHFKSFDFYCYAVGRPHINSNQAGAFCSYKKMLRTIVRSILILF